MNGAGNSRDVPTPLEVVQAVREAHQEFLQGANSTDVLETLFDKTNPKGQTKSAAALDAEGPKGGGGA